LGAGKLAQPICSAAATSTTTGSHGSVRRAVVGWEAAVLEKAFMVGCSVAIK
jgi:hypothetical protein